MTKLIGNTLLRCLDFGCLKMSMTGQETQVKYVFKTKPFTRIDMPTKLKYVGFSIEDVLEIYCLFIRSTAEYCSALEQERKLTNIEKTSLRIILKDMYVSFEAALEMSGLTSLTQRRAAHLLRFAKLSAPHPIHGPRMFLLNQTSRTSTT